MLKLYYRISKYNENGLIKRGRKRRSHSFVKAFTQALQAHFDGVTVSAVISVDNTSTTINIGAGPTAVHPGGYNNWTSFESWVNNPPSLHGGDDIGIVVGTATDALAIADNDLGSIIPHGTSADTLEYLSCAAGDHTESDPNASWTLERFFRNSSGGTITINEVGVYADMYGSSVTCLYNYCIVRDLVSPAETVNDGEYLKVTYTFQIEA